MKPANKKELKKEAEMQMEALKRINRWRMFAMAVSTLGVAASYAGFAGIVPFPFLGIFGVAVTAAAAAAVLILNLGLKNGRRNVGKMLKILEKGIDS